MQIARPRSGFRLVETQNVLLTLESLQGHCPWLALAYANVKERLRFTAHKMGHPIQDGNLSRRVYVDADPLTASNRLSVAYTVLGDKVVVKAIKALAVSNYAG